MPTNRVPVGRAQLPHVTPQAIELYRRFLAARNPDKRNAISWQLHDALGLPPWHVRVCDTLGWAECPWPSNATWTPACELRRQLDMAVREARRPACVKPE